jgi:hypothetical protein
MGQRRGWQRSNRNGKKNACELTDNAAVTRLPELRNSRMTRTVSSQILVMLIRQVSR